MSESLLIDDQSSVAGDENLSTYQKRIQDCISTAKLVYKQLKPKPEKLKQSLFAAELEKDFEIELQEAKRKVKLADDV